MNRIRVRGPVFWGQFECFTDTRRPSSNVITYATMLIAGYGQVGL